MKIYTKKYRSVSGVQKTETEYLGEIIFTKFKNYFRIGDILEKIDKADKLVDEHGKFISKKYISDKIITLVTSQEIIEPELKPPTLGENILQNRINSIQNDINNYINRIKDAILIIDIRRSETENMVKSLDPYFKKLKDLESTNISLRQDLACLQKCKNK